MDGDVERLFAEIRAKDVGAVRALLAGRADLVGARGPGGLPPLHFALYVRASQVVDALLAAGAEPSPFEAAILGDAARVRASVERDRATLTAQGPDGATMLHLAAHFGRVDVLRLLLNLGVPVDLYAGGVFGNTALHAAAAGGQAEAVDVLLRAGARPDLPDKNGCAPLHVAAANGLVGVVEALLAKGADAAAASKDGKTALDVARERGEDEVAALLRARAA